MMVSEQTLLEDDQDTHSLRFSTGTVLAWFPLVVQQPRHSGLFAPFHTIQEPNYPVVCASSNHQTTVRR